MKNLQMLAKSKKFAIIISYISLAVHTVCNLVLTPMYLRYLGLDDYGLYQMIYTVASYILILDFGIKTTMIRYISKYHATNDYESEKNFSAHCFSLMLVIIMLILAIGFVVNANLLKIYPKISDEEADLAHYLFSLQLIVVTETIIERFFEGCLASYEYFSVCNAIGVFKMISKIVLTLVFLVSGFGVISIVYVDIIIITAAIVLMALYAKRTIRFKMKFSGFQITLITEILLFMLPVFLQSIIGYINNYVDKTVLGIMTTKADVAVYSVAMTFITMFNSIPTTISSVFLPQATKLVFGGNCNSDRLTDFIVRPGRYQFMLCAGFIGGFILFGKEFIYLWTGADTTAAWSIVLIIMIPNIIPLIENTVLSILDAMKKRLFRSVVLLLIAVANVFISIFLVSKYGMIGAPIGTAISFIVGYIIILNIYYSRVIKIQVFKMFRRIFSKTWLCLFPPVIIGLLMNMLLPGYSWLGFIVKGFVFVLVYGTVLFLFSFNKQEKEDFTGVLKRIRIIKH